MADAMMMFLGEAHGVNWYWAQPGEFENPGVYYWDGVKNVLCVPHLAASTEAPAQASAVDERDRKDAERYRWLREQMLGVDFDWDESGKTALCFEMPDGCSFAADCDQVIDDASAALAQKGGAA